MNYLYCGKFWELVININGICIADWIFTSALFNCKQGEVIVIGLGVGIVLTWLPILLHCCRAIDWWLGTLKVPLTLINESLFILILGGVPL